MTTITIASQKPNVNGSAGFVVYIAGIAERNRKTCTNAISLIRMKFRSGGATGGAPPELVSRAATSASAVCHRASGSLRKLRSMASARRGGTPARAEATGGAGFVTCIARIACTVGASIGSRAVSAKKPTMPNE
jgi:hypothetical protein